MPLHFGDRLAERVAARESQVVLGLDPDPTRLWPASGSTEAGGAAAQAAADAVALHCEAVIAAAGAACVAIKPQLACFERLGAPGWAALRHVVEHAHAHELLVVADAKRGDISVSAAAYAQALLGRTPTPFGDVDGLSADAATVNPLLGRDALEPFLAVAGEAGAGLFVLVRTSNPGAADVQDLELAEGGPLWERLARLTAEAGSGRVGQSGLSDVGAVVGATAPVHLERARELMPAAVFLLPGIGAQGGRVEDLAPAFAPGRAAGLVTASRAIVDAHLETGGDPASAARKAAEAIRAAAWGLA
ncbi:MAG: orotidine-5-phosphate decarboxylase [Solirubrobacteraceae bacterium]|nr:orotidine-5-phosphate decarboxylase [Solirubrobacteraceae bacterium]